MSYSLSFSPEFFTGECENWDIQKSENPKNCLDALIWMYKFEKKDFFRLVKKVLKYDISKLDYLPEIIPYELVDKIHEVNTCSNLNNPVEVWIDPESEYTIKVYD